MGLNEHFWATKRAAEIKATQDATVNNTPIVGNEEHNDERLQKLDNIVAGKGNTVPPEWTDENGIIQPHLVSANPGAALKGYSDAEVSAAVAKLPKPRATAPARPVSVDVSAKDIAGETARKKKQATIDAKVTDLVNRELPNHLPEVPYNASNHREADTVIQQPGVVSQATEGVHSIIEHAGNVLSDLRSFINNPLHHAQNQANGLIGLANKIDRIQPNHPKANQLRLGAQALLAHAATIKPQELDGKPNKDSDFGGYNSVNDSIVKAGQELASLRSLQGQSTPGQAMGAAPVGFSGNREKEVAAGNVEHDLAAGAARLLTNLAHIHTRLSTSKAVRGLNHGGWLQGIRIPAERTDIELTKRRARLITGNGSDAKRGVVPSYSLTPLTTAVRPAKSAAGSKGKLTNKFAEIPDPNRKGKKLILQGVDEDAMKTYTVDVNQLPETQRAYSDSKNNAIHPVTGQPYRKGDVDDAGKEVVPHPTHYWALTKTKSGSGKLGTPRTEAGSFD